MLTGLKIYLPWPTRYNGNKKLEIKSFIVLYAHLFAKSVTHA